MHLVRPDELAADQPVPIVLGGELLPAEPGVLRELHRTQGLGQRQRRTGRRQVGPDQS